MFQKLMIILSTNFQPSGRVASGQKICRFIFIKAPSYLSLSGQAIIVAEAPALDLITDPFTDFSKDVDGHDAHKGDSEEPGEERGVGAADSDAGRPEAGVTLGEKGLGSDREVGYSESHRVRPLHLSNFM